jgi:DNA-binding MarR family transcriptional regulator
MCGLSGVYVHNELKITEEQVLITLKYLRSLSCNVDAFMIAKMAGIKSSDIVDFIDLIVRLGYIRQSKEDASEKSDMRAKYYTVPEKRDEIDIILSVN